MLTQSDDPWLVTINLLAAVTCRSARTRTKQQAALASRSSRARRALMIEPSYANAQVCVRERLTEVTVLVDWSDATSCNYVCQIWRIGRAAGAGACALSGRVIRRGEFIYRPIPLRSAPSNARAMICAREVQQALDRLGGLVPDQDDA